MHISSLYTYPIKSCGSLSHTEIELDARGLLWDRRWMVVDGDGKFVTQREQPHMAVIQPAFHGDAAAAWMSDYLHTGVRLVRMADDFVRPVNEHFARRPSQTSFSDGFPLLIASEESLAELNRHLVERGKEAVPMRRFRPNVVVSGAEAFAEDQWKTVQMGDMLVDVVKPCARCVMTTVDPATGTIPDSAEPLATLNTFRKINGKVMFAQNAIHQETGILHVGDTIRVIETSNSGI